MALPMIEIIELYMMKDVRECIQCVELPVRRSTDLNKKVGLNLRQ